MFLNLWQPDSRIRNPLKNQGIKKIDGHIQGSCTPPPCFPDMFAVKYVFVALFCVVEYHIPAMKATTAVRRLAKHDRKGRHVFAGEDLAKIFHEDSPRALAACLQRLVKKEILLRVARGVYVYNLSRDRGSGYTIEQIAITLRRGDYSYLSLESALSEYGVISQIPIDRITVMTTGHKGEYKTPFGVIEFTHTKRPWPNIVGCTVDVGRQLRMASRAAALRDLRRVGRNTSLIDEQAIHAD